MKRLLSWLALTTACLAGHAQGNTPGSSMQDDLYQSALLALGEGRLEKASALLRRVVMQEPRHAGAWLDLAISQCELGNAVEAELAFSRLQRQFLLPPGIADTIARYRASGCGKPAAPTPRSLWQLAATRGVDDNINQGASDPRFSLGTGSAQGDYELDPAFLPRSDAFSQLAGSWIRPMGSSDTTLVAQVYSRWHDQEQVQDTASALGAVEHVWRAGGWRLRGTAALGVAALDRVLYQRQRQLQARITPPLPMPQNAEFTFYGNLNHVSYPTRPAYDGNTLELGAIAGYRGKHSLTQATLTGLQEGGSQAKPGGDRKGWFGNVQWYGTLTPTLAFDAGLSWQCWRSERVYLPGLIEAQRLQRTTTVRAAGTWRLRPHTSLVLEWRGVFNRENISLFQYNSRALQLSLRWDNF